jgi:hypothetical protein
MSGLRRTEPYSVPELVMKCTLLCACSLVGTMLFATGGVSAQSDWLAWHGCWQADGAPAAEYLCIVPDGAAAVRLVTVAGGAVVAESRVVTDGRARRVQAEGCDGNEVAFWSADYHRVFLRSELSCEGGVQRQASGVFAITGADSWISVQAVTIDGRTAARTVSYSAVDDGAAPEAIRSALRRSALERTAARTVALSPIDAADVDEAVGRIDAAAVQEWLVATGQPFQLAGELAPAAAGAVTRSALDHTGSFAQDRQQLTNDVVHVVERPLEVVHVVERPVYVTHVHDYRYRSCWDPFFSGFVLGLGHGASIRSGIGHCGPRYITHFSPWGYDLFGWRFVHVRPIVIRGRAVIHHRQPSRPPRLIRTTRRDREQDRSARGALITTPPRHDRTAQLRGDARVTRNAQPRDPVATGGRTSTIRSAQVRPGSSAMTRSARPATPGYGSTARAIPSGGSSRPVRTATPRSTPPSRTPILTPGRQTRHIGVVAPRSTPARPSASSRTPPPARALTPARGAQPRAAVRATPARSQQQPAATAPARTSPSQATAPGRVAKPRGRVRG